MCFITCVVPVCILRRLWQSMCNLCAAHIGVCNSACVPLCSCVRGSSHETSDLSVSDAVLWWTLTQWQDVDKTTMGDNTSKSVQNFRNKFCRTYLCQKHDVRMKLQLLQMIQILIECRIMVGACVWVCVGFVWCLCALCVVWHVWVCVVGGVCVVSCVVRMC